MAGLWYQLKLTMKDKMSIITFFLPLVMALALNLLSDWPFSEVGTTRFAVLSNTESAEIIPMLERYGAVTACDSREELKARVIDPNDDTIGVVPAQGGLEIVLAGDEMSWTAAVASRLESMLRGGEQGMEMTVLPQQNLMGELLNPLIALVLVSALFLGLTFNTINLVMEKEDGVVFVNDVLPLTPLAYLLQKTAIGFLGGVVLTVLSALILFDRLTQLLQLLPLVIFGGFVAAVTGLMIGRLAENLMVSIVYIKIVMLIFMAVPLVAHLFAPQAIQPYFHILPPYTFFAGTIGILEHSANLPLHTGVLFLHSIIWFGIYQLFTGRKKPWSSVL